MKKAINVISIILIIVAVYLIACYFDMIVDMTDTERYFEPWNILYYI